MPSRDTTILNITVCIETVPKHPSLFNSKWAPLLEAFATFSCQYFFLHASGHPFISPNQKGVMNYWKCHEFFFKAIINLVSELNVSVMMFKRDLLNI